MKRRKEEISKEIELFLLDKLRKGRIKSWSLNINIPNVNTLNVNNVNTLNVNNVNTLNVNKGWSSNEENIVINAVFMVSPMAIEISSIKLTFKCPREDAEELLRKIASGD